MYLKRRKWSNCWSFLTILTILLLLFYLFLLDGGGDNDLMMGNLRRIDQVDWFITDIECLKRLQLNLACHAPIKVAAYKSAQLSSLFKVTYSIHFDLTKNYLTLHPINADNDDDGVVRLLPKHLKILPNQQLQLTNADSQVANLAHSSQFFVRSWLSGKMLECKGLIKAKEDQSRRIPLSRMYIFGEVLEDLSELEAIPFLMSGTLLGWYRECSLITHTTDIDFAIQSRDLSHELVSKVVQTYSMLHVLGDQVKLNDAMEMTFRIGDVKVDLFAMKELNETTDYFQVFGFIKHRSYRGLFPKIKELCASDLHNYLVYVPCNVEAILKAEFGDWKQEIHTNMYNYLSPKNIILNKEFTDSEWSQQYEHFYFQAFLYRLKRFFS